MKSIIQKIKESVENSTGMMFYYDTPQTLNLRLDHAKFPCAMLHIVESGAVQDTNGVLRERMTIEVLFATQSNLDFDGLKVENSELNRLKIKAFEWLLAMLRMKTELRCVSLNGTSRYYATDDAIYSAFGVNVTIEEVEGISKCNYEDPTAK